MPLSDLIAAALAGPAGRVLDGPVRAIVAEVMAAQGGPGPAELAELREAVGELRRTLAGLEERAARAEELAGELAAQVAELREALAEAEAKRGAAPADSAASSPETSAPAGEPAAAPACRVEGCAEPAARDGFCLAHHARWFAGRLPGFVGPEGLVEVDGAPYRVDPALAGEPYTVTGTKRRMVRVRGKAVRKHALG